MDTVLAVLAIATTLLAAARTFFVVEQQMKTAIERLDRKRETLAEHDKQLQTHGIEIVTLTRDLHALRGSQAATDLRVEKAIAAMESRLDKRLDSLEDLVKRALELSSPGGRT